MKRISASLLLLCIAVPAAQAQTGTDSSQPDWSSKEVSEVTLRMQPLEPLPVVTPRPDYRDTVGQPDGRCYAQIPSSSEQGLAVDAVTRTEVRVDTDGDGTPDQSVGAGKPVVVVSPLGEETKRPYALSFIRDTACTKGKKFRYRRACAMVGKFKGQRILLIDENSNGIYGEMGKDAISFGKAQGAHWLSPVVLIKKNLYHMQVNQEGSKLRLVPYEGETGRVNLLSKLRLHGKLMLGMIKQGEMCFDAAVAKKVDVPVGKYTFDGGAVGLNIKKYCRIQTGTMEPFQVAEGETHTQKWGSPGKIEFTKTISGGKLRISPSIKYIGSAGEVYTGFVPKDPLPLVEVYEAGRSGKPEKKFSTSRMPCG